MPTVTAYTQPGDDRDRTENEDCYITLPGLVVVLDGATIRTETGCIHGLPWYVHQLATAIVTAAQNTDTTLPAALADAIASVTNLHAGTCDLTHPGTPSAAVGIVRHNADRIEWCVLGDIAVMVQPVMGDLLVTSDERVSQTGLDLRRKCDRYLIGTDEKMNAILAMKEVELASRNVDGGYWIAAADPAAASHALTGATSADSVQRIGVCSDGVMRALTMTGIATPKSVMGVLLRSGPKVLVERVREAERNDPLGERVPRNKATDDATAVHIDMHHQQRREVSATERSEAIRQVVEPTHGNLYGAVPTSTGKVYL